MPSPPPSTISLPGWDSIIAMPHGTPPSKAQYQQYYRSKRAGTRPDLPDGVISEIERRSDIRNRIQSSTAPATAKAWTKVLTALDDAQDMFSLVAFGGRLAYKIAPKIMGRFIPGLAWILVGQDILQLLTMLATILQPFFVAMCHGFSLGLVASLPALMIGNTAKIVGHRAVGLNPFRSMARFQRKQKFSGRLFRTGELLELAQVAKTITGYGLTLGGIMGTITESAYAIELALRGQPISIAVPGGARLALTGQTGTATAAGSPAALSSIYNAMGAMMLNPTDKAAARAKADALASYGN